MAVNFSKNQDEIIGAWKKVVDSTLQSNWAVYGYEGTTNVIRLMSTGTNGLEGLVSEFNNSMIQYAFCRVIDDQIGLNKLVLINWQGESAPLSRKGLCASHVGDVANYFKGCTQTITIRNDDEATKEHLMDQILKSSASKINLSRQQQTKVFNDSDNNHQKTSVKTSSSSGQKSDIASELAATRKSFWQQQEEEEKERVAEEKRRAAERQAQFEKERKQREESERKKLAETIEQRDRLIDATRQADRKTSAVNNSAASSSSGNSQPSSILSSSGPATDAADDDGRVGRRSELIRLERNQETQSLISKGLIKNKRAIFEQQASQAQQQQQQQQQPTTLSRRASGAMITQRLNAFKSLDGSSASSSSFDNATTPPTKNVVNQMANGFARKVSVSGDGADNNDASPRAEVVSSIKKEVETTNEEDESNVNHNNTSDRANDSFDSNAAKQSEVSPAKAAHLSTSESIKESPTKTPTGSIHSTTQDMNGNSRHNSPAVKQASGDDVAEINGEDNQLVSNGKLCEAIALFDYESADSTEISFDPDDRIGNIQKVDSGWWQGKVMSGRFKGQVGLFPSNYVKEL